MTASRCQTRPLARAAWGRGKRVRAPWHRWEDGDLTGEFDLRHGFWPEVQAANYYLAYLAQRKGGGSMKRPHWRKMTWVVLVWNVLMLVWLISAAVTANGAATKINHCSQQQYATLCRDATATGGALAIGAIIGIWVAGAVILGVIWLVTRGRECSACGRRVRRGLTTCRSCGHDFRVSGTPAV